jgi:hypothetical protein
MSYEVKITTFSGVLLDKFNDLLKALEFFKKSETAAFAEIWCDKVFVKSFSSVSSFEDYVIIRTLVDTPIKKSDLVDNNPKTLAALKKARVSDVPPVALFALGAAMSDGADKYGRFNYRDTSATASVFYDAILRHLVDWYNGEDYAHDSKVHHLAHIMASCAILLDTMRNGNFNDDRDVRQPESIARNPQNWKELNNG